MTKRALSKRARGGDATPPMAASTSLALAPPPTFPPPTSNARTRVACLGDSLTHGDDGKTDSWPKQSCGIATFACRGSYLSVLQLLLGSYYYEVKGFAANGLQLAHLVPPDCRSGHEIHNESCRAALDRVTFVRDLLKFKPSIQVILLGTNDAMDFLIGEGVVTHTAHSFKALMLRLLRVVHGHARLTLLMEPPTTMAEVPRKPDGSCGQHENPPPSISKSIYFRPNGSTCECQATHMCYYGGGCDVKRCLSCGLNETVNIPRFDISRCIRVDALVEIRRGVRQLVNETVDSGVHHASAASDLHCAGGLYGLPPIPVAASWFTFMDIYHFRPVGSAAMACHVHAHLMSRCESMKDRLEMAKRHEMYCKPVMRVAERPTRASLWGLIPIFGSLRNWSTESDGLDTGV